MMKNVKKFMVGLLTVVTLSTAFSPETIQAAKKKNNTFSINKLHFENLHSWRETTDYYFDGSDPDDEERYEAKFKKINQKKCILEVFEGSEAVIKLHINKGDKLVLKKNSSVEQLKVEQENKMYAIANAKKKNTCSLDAENKTGWISLAIPYGTVPMDTTQNIEIQVGRVPKGKKAVWKNVNSIVTVNLVVKHLATKDEEYMKLLRTVGYKDTYTDLEKLLFLKYYMDSFYEYDSSINGPAEAIKYGAGACWEHAILFERFCHAMGIDGRFVCSTKDDHAYNVVKLEGKWYICDTTCPPVRGALGASYLVGLNQEYGFFGDNKDYHININNIDEDKKETVMKDVKLEYTDYPIPEKYIKDYVINPEPLGLPTENYGTAEFSE